MRGGLFSRTSRGKLAISPVPVLIATVIGCGMVDEADREDVTPARTAELTAAQVAAARQAGLFPNLGTGYAPLELFDDPTTAQSNSPPCTTGSGGINSSGVTVGWDCRVSNSFAATGSVAPAFVTGPSGTATLSTSAPNYAPTTELALPSGSTVIYPTALNDNGDKAGVGYTPSTGLWLPLVLWQGSNAPRVLPGLPSHTSVKAMTNDANPVLVGSTIDPAHPSTNNYVWYRYDSSTTAPAILTPDASFNAVTGAPYGMNRAQEIVGMFMKAAWSYTTPWWAFAYKNGGFVDLSAQMQANSPFQRLEVARAINDNHQIVGTGLLKSDGSGNWYRHAFKADLNTGRVIDLGTISPYWYSGQDYVAEAINSKGHVVGTIDSGGTSTRPGSYPSRAFIWTQEWGMLDLTTFIDPSLGLVLNDAFGINDNDEIVGWVKPANAGYRLYRIKVSFPGPEFYEPTDGQDCSVGQAINASGAITGWSDACAATTAGITQAYPFATKDGIPIRLGMPANTTVFPWSINNAGYVVGGAYQPANGRSLPALVYPPSSWATPVSLPGITADTSVTDINNETGADGPMFVGATDSGRYHWYSGRTGGSQPYSQDITQHPSWGVTGMPLAVSDRCNTVAGSLRECDEAGLYFESSGAPRAAVLLDDQLMKLNDTLVPPFLDWDLTIAFDINSRRQVVGAGLLNGTFHAFRMDINSWGDIVDLGMLPGYESLAMHAQGINSRGHVVGSAGTPLDGFGYRFAPARAFIYTDETGLTDLNDMVAVPPGWVLASAVAINDNDEVTGVAIGPGGLRRAYKITVPGQAFGLPNHDPAVSVIPYLDCVFNHPNGSWSAVFGYRSSSPDKNVPVAYGNSNYLSTAGSRDEAPKTFPPTIFLPGDHSGAFVIDTTAPYLSWTVDGHIAEASPTSFQCAVTQDATGQYAQLPHGGTAALSQDPTVAFQGGVIDTATTDGTTPGKVQGAFTVTSDGAAEYRVPIWVPQGRAGIQPSLAVAYNSRAGDGPLGIGWSIEGLSRITRCRKTIYDDGATDVIHFDSSDRFCLDGQRLIAVNGVYGADGTEYHTSKESFVKVVSHGSDAMGPDYFEVLEPSGRIRTYGQAGHSRIESVRYTFVGDFTNASDLQTYANETETIRFGWSLSGVRDRSGNAMSLTYYSHSGADIFDPDEPEAVEPTLDHIDYTSGVNRPALRSVVFRYDGPPRPDKSSSYVAGMKFRVTRRLSKIEIKGPNPVTPGILKTYDFGFDTNIVTGRGRLSSITECDASSPPVCKRPLTFEWEDGTLDYEDKDTGITDIVAPEKDNFWQITVGDFNGDGKDDIIYPRMNGVQDDHYTGCHTIAELFCPTDLRENLQARLSTGDGFGAPTQLTIIRDGQVPPVGHPPYDQLGMTSYEEMLALDVDGDGRTDLVRHDDFQHYNTYLATTDNGVPAFKFSLPDLNGNGTIEASENTAPISPYLVKDGAPYVESFYFADINGDGRTDHISASPQLQFMGQPNVWMYRTNVGAGLFAGPEPFFKTTSGNDVVITSIEPAYDPWNSAIANLSGDGRTNFLFRDTTVDETGEKVSGAHFSALRLKKASPPLTGTMPEVIPTGIYTTNDRTATGRKNLFLDVNGDGLDDNVWVHNQGDDQINIRINTGKVFAPPVSFLPNAGDAIGKFVLAHDVLSLYRDPGARFGDYNGDGKTDIFLFGENDGARDTVHVLVSNGSRFFPVDVGIATGMATGNWFTNQDPDYAVRAGYRLSQVLDVNGDGMLDFVQVPKTTQWPKTLHLYIRKGNRPDQIKAIRDGSGRTTSITYAPIADGSVYTKGSACQYPQICAKNGTQVVKQFDQTNPAGGLNTYSITYEDGRIDVQGPGWLGFRKKVTKELFTGITDTETFSLDRDTDANSYVIGGALVEREHDVPISPLGQHVVFKTSYSYENIAGNPLNEPLTHTLRTIRESVTEGGVLRSQKTTISVFERQYGLLVTNQVTTNNGIEEFTQPGYTSYPSLWPPRQLSGSTTTFKEGGIVIGSRSSSVTRDPNTGLILTQTDNPTGGPAEWLKRTFQRDPDTGQVLAITSETKTGEKRWDATRYDAIDGTFPVFTTNAAGHSRTTTVHPGLGVVLKQVDANNVVSAGVFDRFGRPVHQSPPVGDGVDFDYLSTAEGPVVVDAHRPDGRHDIAVFDAFDQPKIHRVTAFDGRLTETRTTYDRMGRVSTQTRPYFVGDTVRPTMSILYDYLGRVTDEIRPNTVNGSGPETKVTRTYPDVLTERVTDEVGHITQRVRDVRGRLQQSTIVTSHGDVTSTFDYGAFDQLAHVYDSENHETEVTYDGIGRRMSLRDPDAGLVRYEYNAFGEIVRETTADNHAKAIHHDVIGRVTSRVSADGVAYYEWDTAAHGVGKLAGSISEDAIVTKNTYDSVGRATNQSWSVAGTMYAIDTEFNGPGGNVSVVSYPGFVGARFRSTYRYNQLGFVNEVDNTTNGVTPIWTSTDPREPDGQISAEQFGDGSGEMHHYDRDRGWVTQDTTTTASAGIVANVSYAHYADGSVWTRTRDGIEEKFEYDDFNRLFRWSSAGRWSQKYVYDDLGNRTDVVIEAGVGVGYHADFSGAQVHAPSAVNGQAVSYDAFGDRLNGNGLTLAYNDRHLVTSVSRGASTATFLYDAGDTRVVKRESGLSTISIGGVFEQQIDGQGGVSEKFYVGNGSRIVAVVARSGAASGDVATYLHAGMNGTIDLTTSDQGPPSRFYYSPFGERLDEAQLPAAAPFATAPASPQMGFDGHRHLDTLGIVDTGGRIYDPRLGSFVSPDPLTGDGADPRALNRYAFAGNNPTRFIDPSGLSEDDVDQGPSVEWSSEQVPDSLRATDRLPGADVMPCDNPSDYEVLAKNLQMGGFDSWYEVATGLVHYWPAGKESAEFSEYETSAAVSPAADDMKVTSGPGGGNSGSGGGWSLPDRHAALMIGAQVLFTGLSFVPGLSVFANIAGAALAAYEGNYVAAAVMAAGAAIPGIVGIVGRMAAKGASEAAVVANAAEEVAGARTLFHYTNEAGQVGINESKVLNPSLKALKPSDVRYGNGQYLSDILPGTKTPAQLSREFLGIPYQGSRFTHYVEIDVTGLNVVQGRAGVFVVPNEVPLDLTGRIVSSGAVP